MQLGQPSRTSILVAAARAFGAREPEAAVRNPDYLAARLIGPAERRLIAAHPMAAALEEDYQQAREKPEVGGISNTLLARTRFIDEHLERAVQCGVRQVVILGAGLDTRAYRFHELLKERKVFEVDYAATQQFKKRRVTEAIGEPPSNVVFVEVDFQRETLRGVLVKAGYRTDEKTFFIWEGVSMYLHEERVRDTLKFIATSSASGSSLAMDFAGEAIIDLLRKFPAMPQHRHTTDWGEPWLFGVPDGREREFFGGCGLELRETMRLFGREVSERYLTRADGTKLGPRRPPRLGAGFLTRLRMMLAIAGLIRKKSNWYSVVEVIVP